MLRHHMELKKGLKIEKHFAGHGVTEGTLVKKETVDSTLFHGQEREAWLVRYADGHEEHYEDEELRSGKHDQVPAGNDGPHLRLAWCACSAAGRRSGCASQCAIERGRCLVVRPVRD